MLIRPALVAGFRGLSESAILPWLRRGRWIRAGPNRWAYRSDQGQGAAPREEQIAQPKGSTGLETGFWITGRIGVQPTKA